MGVETEYGVQCTDAGRRTLTPDEVARHLFYDLVATHYSSNVFLANGGRLYLDVGNHPEYATAECDDLADVLAQERAGTRMMNELVVQAQARMARDGTPGQVYLLKNNVDSAGASYGCHENYLVDRGLDLRVLAGGLAAFLVTRQLVCGAGRLVREPDGSARYCLSQRADLMWDVASSATTRSRPMINTRDEPHADATRFRRLHVIVGDSNMAESGTLLKVGATDLMLRALEAGRPASAGFLASTGAAASTVLPALTGTTGAVGTAGSGHDHPVALAPANPAQAIRAINRDLTGRARYETADGRSLTALEAQRACHAFAAAHIAAHGSTRDWDDVVLNLWDEVLSALEDDAADRVAGHVDWIAKRAVLARGAQRHGLDLERDAADPRLAFLDLLYHDIDPERGLASRLESAGTLRRWTTHEQVDRAMTDPPATTRAALRSRFLIAARQHRRDHQADWTHLRVDPSQFGPSVLLDDPFAASDPRVDELIARLDARR